MICYFLFLQDRARELADIVGGEALSLAELNNFHPEDGMILANTTSIGMQPKIDETPVSKVCLLTIITLSYISSCWNFSYSTFALVAVIMEGMKWIWVWACIQEFLMSS